MSYSPSTALKIIIGENRAREQAMGLDQRARVAQSLVGIPHDTYAKRAKVGADADLVSIEIGLISAQARAAGLAGIIDNDDPGFKMLVADIESAIERVMLLKALRTA